MDTSEWYIVSDLHLDEQPGPRGVDAAFTRFLDTVVRVSTSRRRNLILLGDTFDLQGPVRQSTAALARRLTCLAGAHAGILHALAGCVRAGIALHVVGGNHDIELTRPALAAQFTTLLGLEVGDPGVRFSPWVLHEPGVLYAEHGNQHHEFNRIPTVLSVREPDGSHAELPVTPLGAASPGYPGCSGEGAVAVRVARSLRSTRRHEQMARTPWYQALLDREAAVLGMSSPALADLAAMSRFRAGRAFAATARRTVERHIGVERPGSYLAPRAAAIHRTLTRHDVPAAAYVFGHSHRAASINLTDAPAAAYLNAGTWGLDVRGPGPDQTDRRLFPFIRIASTPDGVDADLLFWRYPA